MRQVVAIHGGDAFPTYEEYLEDLRDFKIESIDYFKRQNDWKQNLQKTLGDGYEVILPRMPNSGNARYLDWKIWFEKLLPLLNNGIILIGHSLGASFLAKYLSEERVSKKILGTFLVSGPYDKDGERPIVEFVLPASLALLEEQGGKIFLYHSKDDPVVQFSELAKYKAALPHAHVTVLEDRQHVNQESFPEIVADIKSL
jgi:predicted alpha/beta hydrolase family esterase